MWLDEGSLDLGRLKGNQGDQNYELAADIDLSQYTSIVIWCDRFDSAFGGGRPRSSRGVNAGHDAGTRRPQLVAQPPLSPGGWAVRRGNLGSGSTEASRERRAATGG